MECTVQEIEMCNKVLTEKTENVSSGVDECEGIVTKINNTHKAMNRSKRAIKMEGMEKRGKK